MTCISCMPRTAGCSLAKSIKHSPHSIQVPPLDLGIAPYLAVLFGPQKADQDHQNKKVNQEGSQAPDANQAQDNELPSPDEVLVTLRVQVDSCRPADLSALTTILLGGTPAICRNRLLWIQAVKDHFDDVPLFVSCCKLLQLVCETAPQVGYDVYLVDPGGCHQLGDLVALCCGSTPFPGSGVHVSIRAKMYWSLQMTHSWSTLIARGWVVMTWEVSKTTISVSVLTSTVSPFMALR